MQTMSLCLLMEFPRFPWRIVLVGISVLCFAMELTWADLVRPAPTLEQLLKQTPMESLVSEIQARGNPQKGALLFYKSAAACAQCHVGVDGAPSVGPELGNLRTSSDSTAITEEYLVQSMLYPSKDIRPPFRVVSILTDDEQTVVGSILSEDKDRIIVRPINDLTSSIAIETAKIDARKDSPLSMMPDGLISSMRDQGEFFDLAAYVFEVVRGGRKREAALKPTPQQLAIKEDWLDLDHAGIIKSLGKKDFDSGKSIFQGYCADCHGADGNRPSLPTARSFGTQPMKFGADPYRMFMTLTKGNGLMGSMSHLTPHQRYEVIHYIREAFMKPSNQDFFKIDSKYLAALPKGMKDGTYVEPVERDFGIALGSQLDRTYESILTADLAPWSIAYDLHSMNIAGIWKDGYLDVQNTQHALPRGEGTVSPSNPLEIGFQGWEWGHGGTLKYDRTDLLPRGPMPAKWMEYKGYYQAGKQLVMSYSIDRRPILELPTALPRSAGLRRTLEIGAGNELVLAIVDWGVANPASLKWQPSSEGAMTSAMATASIPSPDSTTKNLFAVVSSKHARLELKFDDQQRLVLTIPKSDSTNIIDVCVAMDIANKDAEDTNVLNVDQVLSTMVQPSHVVQEAHTVWPEMLETVGYRGLEPDGYALDTLTIPSRSASNTWFRTAALDFLSDGRMVVSMYGGDVWLVSGIDEGLMSLKWKRFASGLYEPLGLKVVRDAIYVTCKDRIVRLHDRNGDGEADFYENFSDDTDVSVNFHAFNFDLQTDPDGYFYYAKGGHGADYAIPGSILRISPDGKNREVFATGFRVPNGMGALPNGMMTCSDNQGQWMPSSKINLLKPRGFYGWSPTYDGKGKWSADGGKIDIKKIVPPNTFDPPLVWIPHDIDNSSGGQVFVDDARWGPLAGRLLHTSFGKGWLSYVMMQEVEGVHQAAIVRLPFDFRTGIMRGRVNPKDGQLYVVGLQGWNGSGRIGLQESGIQRLRYTGKPWRMVTGALVEHDSLQLRFNFAIDPKSAREPNAVEAIQWNYKWQASYGSERYSPSTGAVGTDGLQIDRIVVDDDGKSVTIHSKDVRPVDQLQLRLLLRGEDGELFQEEVLWTIHKVPAVR